MADSFTPNLNLRKPEVGAADDTWGGVAGLNGDLDLLDAVFLATGLGTSVGIHVGTGKVLNVEGQLQLADSTDTTKRTTFSVDLVAAATTIDLKIPPASGTIATKEIVVATVTASHPVGTILSGYYGAAAPSGYVFADGRTIGDATSLATNRANADCERLFKHFWNFNDNTRFPVLPTRGATADADWLAHKQLTLPDHSGAGMAGRDDLSGTSRNRLAPGMANATVRGALGGQPTEAAGVSGSFSGSGGGSTSGSLSVSGTQQGNFSVLRGAEGTDGPLVPQNGATSDVTGATSGALSVGVNVSGSISGATATVTNVQTTIVVDVVIAL